MHYFTLWHTHIALWQHPTLQPTSVIEILLLNIKTYLGGEYAASHYIIGLASIAANICNPAGYMQTLLSKATAYYKLTPTNFFYLE